MHSCYQDTHCKRFKKLRRNFGDLLRHVQISEAKFCPTSLRSNRIKLPELEQLYQILFATYLTLPGRGCLLGVFAWGICPGSGSATGGSVWGGCLPRVTDFLTHACEIISFPQLRLRTVITTKYRYWRA